MRGMNADAPISNATTPALPPGLRALWDEANGWVAWLLGMFDGATLRTTGVSRERGARLGVWLMGIESAVRRIILAAALVFTPPALRSRTSEPRPRTQATAQRRASFCVFHLNSGEHEPRAHAATAGRANATPKPYGHVVFPRDPLLRLGASPRRPPRIERTAPRARNPLDRWLSLSRHDPDWRPSPDDGALMFSAPPEPLWRPPRMPRPQTVSHGDDAGQASLADWRRRHDEWRKIIPAPGLAARLEALARIAANPAAAIARAARRLQRSQGLAIRLARDATPPWRPPPRAAHIPTAGHTFDIAERTHAALVIPDTS